MSLLKRGKVWYVVVKWRDVPRMRLSTGTGNRGLARAMQDSLRRLYEHGRLDFFDGLKDGAKTLRQVHHAVCQGPGAVDVLARLEAESPPLGPLVDDWLAWIAGPAGLSPRTRRRYAPKTIRRYRVSWDGFFAALPQGRGARLADITAGFVADFKRSRVRAQGGGARGPGVRVRMLVPDRPLAVGTMNRDLAALGAFLTWALDVRKLAVVRPKLGREKEPQGRERWLSPDELRALERAARELEPAWWPLIATLAFTGMRYGEAAGLRGADVRLRDRRISVNESDRRVKTASSVRDVPIPEPLAVVLAEHLARVSPGPAALVFPAPLCEYDRAQGAFRRVCLLAGIHDGAKKKRRPTATLHDLRHTFGVHAAQAGVPVVRLQKLLGHASPLMTLRYMKHAPEAYFAEDAARIAGSMTSDAEAEARAKLAREGMKSA